MEKTESIVTNKVRITKKAIVFSVLISIAVVTPAIIHNQAITGPIVNTTLFLAAVLLSPEIALLVGLFPSLIALSSGLLPALLAPMVPFIMIGNAILILTFSYLKKRNFWIGVGVASLFKFLFLFSTSSLVVNLLLKKELAGQVSLMMSWPQLMTAFAGGLIAFFVLKILKEV